MTARDEAARSRRERPAKPALTRAGIVAAAVAVLRAEGLGKVTMRRLAQELDTGPASLYVYVSNTAELHAAILDELLGTIPVPPADGDWRERLEALLTSYTAMLFEHPSLARSALTARPSGPHYLNLIERMLALLADGAVPADRAAWGVDVLLLITTAHAAEHADEAAAPTPEAKREWDTLTAALRGASTDAHPHIAAQAANLLSGQPGQRLSWAIRSLIDGLARTPIPTDTPGGPS